MGMEKITNLDSTSADGMVVTQVFMMNEVAAIGGSDPSAQVGLSYGRFWAQTNVCAFRYSSLILSLTLLP